MFGTAKSFRWMGILEGSSFLILLGIAMPLKYFAGYPMAVKMVGWAHGLLFILYILEAYSLASNLNWPRKTLFLAFVAAVVPFGPFIFDRQYLRKTTNSLWS